MRSTVGIPVVYGGEDVNAVPYMAWQHKINKKALDDLEALNDIRSQDR